MLLAVDGRREPTKSLRLQAAIREAIRAEQLAAGDRLPSTRRLADDLGVARNVVVDAYDQLVAQGYLSSRGGSGTRVAARAATDHAPPRPTVAAATHHRVRIICRRGSPTSPPFRCASGGAA